MDSAQVLSLKVDGIESRLRVVESKGGQGTSAIEMKKIISRLAKLENNVEQLTKKE